MRFPKADDQQQADNCLLIAQGDKMSPHWLAYELARDFLSVPRTFAVVAIYSEFEFDWQDPQLADNLDSGIHKVKTSDTEALAENVDCWRINLSNMHLDVWGDLQLQETIYGAASATEALVRVLSANAQ